MAQSTRTTALNRMHQAVKELTDQLELISGHPPEGLEDLKSSVDEVRLRLWGVLMSSSAHGEKDFSERFRLRRAAEILQGLLADVEAGRVKLTSKEAADLGVVAREIGRRVTAAAH
jgi:hypothetical protein